MHLPSYQEREQAEKLVIFIHGFMGSPDHFVDLAELVYEHGCSTLSILLPGHGAGMREFVRSDMDDWTRHVQEEIDKVRDKYKTIFLVGHSMGGLLAINASLVKANRIAGLVLIAVPMKLNLKSVYLKLRLLTFPRENEIKQAYVKSKSIGTSAVFYYPCIIRPILSLFQLIKQTKQRLPEVSVPVYLFYSKSDETVSYKSAKLLYEGLCNTERTAFSLDRSWHAFYYEDERGIIAKKLLELI